MIRIQKDNIQLRIDESELKYYKSQGYEEVPKLKEEPLKKIEISKKEKVEEKKTK